MMNFEIGCELEDDGRWLAEAPQLPGVLAYGFTRDEAMAKAQVLPLRVLAERLEHGQSRPDADWHVHAKDGLRESNPAAVGTRRDAPSKQIGCNCVRPTRERIAVTALGGSALAQDRIDRC
jgi:predicted RNase H-like HicB family nuclease